MSLLFETISIRNGVAENLDWHQQRLEASWQKLSGKRSCILLANELSIPAHAMTGHFRCRVDYSEKITKTEFSPYRVKEINHLKLIDDNQIDYSLKFSDRTRLNHLFSLRQGADDILIVKHGKITDTSFANIIFWDGKAWFTPSTPLLAGTCRARMLDQGLISEADISPADLSQFTAFKLINALRCADEIAASKTENISK